jgi:hypothetical protein
MAETLPDKRDRNGSEGFTKTCRGALRETKGETERGETEEAKVEIDREKLRLRETECIERENKISRIQRVLFTPTRHSAQRLLFSLIAGSSLHCGKASRSESRGPAYHINNKTSNKHDHVRSMEEWDERTHEAGKEVASICAIIKKSMAMTHAL